MKVAHQGVVPAALLGVAGGGWMNSNPPQGGNAPPVASSQPPQSGNGGLDFWLLDKLFGRR